MSTNPVGTYVFGGSFDPIHQGHLGVIAEVLPIAKTVLLAPTAKNPLKDAARASYSDRCRMIELVLEWENIPYTTQLGNEGLVLCKEEYVFAEELLLKVRPSYPGPWYWVVGPDLATQIYTWKNWNSLEVGVYVSQEYADQLHAVQIREGERPPHPAISAFIDSRSLYTHRNRVFRP